MKLFNLFKNLKKYDSKDYIFFGDNDFNISENINNNYLIVGPCGCGKSLNFFTPNIMNQDNCSIVCFDLKMELFNRCREDLGLKGYKTFYLSRDNFFYNIFSSSKTYEIINNSFKDEEITKVLDVFYEIKDEDDYYSNIEISLLRAIAKKLVLDRNEINLKDVFNYWSDLDFYHVENYFKDYNDEYINDNLEEFVILTKDLSYDGFVNLKNKVKNKFEIDNKDFSKFDFSILRKEKIALFLETNDYSHNEYNLCPFVFNLFNQIIDKYEGYKIKLFLDDFVCLRNFDKLREILALSRGRNYSLFIGIQNLEQLKYFNKYCYIDNILLFNNFVFFGSNRYAYEDYKEVLNILRIDFKPVFLESLKPGECLFYFSEKFGKIGFKYVKFKNNKLLKKINNI